MRLAFDHTRLGICVEDGQDHRGRQDPVSHDAADESDSLPRCEIPLRTHRLNGIAAGPAALSAESGKIRDGASGCMGRKAGIKRRPSDKVCHPSNPELLKTS